MNLKNQPPIFVPAEYRAEIERFSKAALMDMVWDLCTLRAVSTDGEEIIAVVREVADIVQTHRQQAKAA